GHHVVDLAVEPFAPTRVVVAATKRGEHRDNPGLAVGGGTLVIGSGLLGPHLADRVTVAAGDPDDRRVLRAVAWVGGDVGHKLSERRLIADQVEDPGRWRGDGGFESARLGDPG